LTPTTTTTTTSISPTTTTITSRGITSTDIIYSSSLSSGINLISSNTISMDIDTLRARNKNIGEGLKDILKETGITSDYITEQIGDILYVYIGVTEFLQENYAEEIKYIIFKFNDTSKLNNLLNINKKINYINYILIILILILVGYILYNSKN
jgi:hypothetical protein